MALAGARPAAGQNPELAPLQLFFNGRRSDNYVTATAEGRRAAEQAGYTAIRVEACIFTSQQPGTVPLNQYWSSERGDNFATDSLLETKGASNPGNYVLIRVEGFIYRGPQKGTVPLVLYYHNQRHDNLTAATEAAAEDARRAGYTTVGILGYVLPASACQSH